MRARWISRARIVKVAHFRRQRLPERRRLVNGHRRRLEMAVIAAYTHNFCLSFVSRAHHFWITI